MLYSLYSCQIYKTRPLFHFTQTLILIPPGRHAEQQRWKVTFLMNPTYAVFLIHHLFFAEHRCRNHVLVRGFVGCEYINDGDDDDANDDDKKQIQ